MFGDMSVHWGGIVPCRAGGRAVDLGGPKFEIKHKSRCLQKSRPKRVDWEAKHVDREAKHAPWHRL